MEEPWEQSIYNKWWANHKNNDDEKDQYKDKDNDQYKYKYKDKDKVFPANRIVWWAKD